MSRFKRSRVFCQLNVVSDWVFNIAFTFSSTAWLFLWVSLSGSIMVVLVETLWVPVTFTCAETASWESCFGVSDLHWPLTVVTVVTRLFDGVGGLVCSYVIMTTVRMSLESVHRASVAFYSPWLVPLNEEFETRVVLLNSPFCIQVHADGIHYNPVTCVRLPHTNDVLLQAWNSYWNYQQFAPPILGFVCQLVLQVQIS